MDVLTSETCWALNNEIIKQVISSWSLFIQLFKVTSIYQPTNAHIISHKTHLKHSDMFRSSQIINRELCSLLKLYYGIHSSIRICKRGVVAAYQVVWECVVEQWLGVGRTPSHCSTIQHDMLPQHLLCKYELYCEYRNITLARNKAPWWCSDKIETCRSVLKCFKSVLCEIICAFVGW